MVETYFEPVSLDKIFQSNIPEGMYYLFSLKNKSMTNRFEEFLFSEAVRWCEDNFAEQYPCEPTRWAGCKQFSFYRIFFRSSTDAAAFKLRWC